MSRLHDGPQRWLTPDYSVILISRDDLDVAELVRRRCGKQGPKNALVNLNRRPPTAQPLGVGHPGYNCRLPPQGGRLPWFDRS